MSKLMTKILIFMFAFNLVVPVAVKADENAGGTTNTPANDGNTTTPDTATSVNSPKPHKHHRKHKKSTSDSTTSNASAAPAGADTRAGTVDGRTQAPGMSNSIGSNNPGEPNMGSPDHVPGTTGTSGQ